MKVNMEVDATPEELRRFFGLPDVQPLHDEMMELIRQRMHAGSEGYDPLSLMSPLIPSHFQNMEGFQKALWEAFSQSTGKGKGKGTGKGKGSGGGKGE